jgi:ABC-type glucose/galactose transport system permease subunit
MINKIFPSDLQGMAVSINLFISTIIGSIVILVLGILSDYYDTVHNPEIIG